MKSRESDSTGGEPTPAPSLSDERGLRSGISVLRFLLLLFGACQLASPPAADVAPSRPAPRKVDFRTEQLLDTIERSTFNYFWETASPRNGLVPDRAPTPSFSSVAAVGFGLTAEVIGAERGWVDRGEAADRVSRTLRFLRELPQSGAVSGAGGFRGFFYHFLDMDTGRRFERIELSTIDSALLFAGALTCAAYFDRENPTETRIREDAEAIYRRAEWDWASPRPPGIAMGWTPEEGFHGWNWHGYDESMILYILALGSPTHPADPRGWGEFVSTYRWGTYFGQTYVQFSPLFGHQYSHVWIDFRGIRDPYMRSKGIDYFTNSARATYANRNHCIANPGGWKGYGDLVWGLTASDGPLPAAAGGARGATPFHAYWARGAGPAGADDDGTIAPTAAGGSVPFAPEVTIPTLVHLRERFGDRLYGRYGFRDAFNLSYPGASGEGWFDDQYLAIDQGPILLMVENYRTGFVWNLLKKSPYVVAGLRRAGFTGGWLGSAPLASTAP